MKTNFTIHSVVIPKITQKNSKNKVQDSNFRKLNRKTDANVALENQGRACIALSNLSFKGNPNESLLFKKYQNETDLSDDTIKRLITLTPQQQEECLALYREEIFGENALIDIVLEEDKQVKEKIIELTHKGIEAINLLEYAKYSCTNQDTGEIDKELALKKLNSISLLLEKGLNPQNASVCISFDCTDFDQDWIDNINELIDKINSTFEMSIMNTLENGTIFGDLMGFSTEMLNEFSQLLDNGWRNLSLIKEMCKDQSTRKFNEALLQEGYDENEIFDLNSYKDDDDFETIKKYVKDYSITAHQAKYFIALENKDPQKALQFKPYIKDISANIPKIPDDIFDSVVELYKEGYTSQDIDEHINEYFETSYNDLRNFIQENKENNSRLDEIIENSQISSRSQQELSKEDRIFLKRNIFTNEYYTPEEYLNLFLSLKNLKTPNGESILGCESFTNKIKANGLGDAASRYDDILYKNIQTILSCNPKEEKMQYLEKILKLIRDGKINSSALRKLSDLNSFKSLAELLFDIKENSATAASSWQISNNLKEDIDLIFDNDTNKNNWIDKYIPTYKDEKEGIKNQRIGDAFIVENEDYIRIKTKDNESQTIKLTKETYAKLFPPIERFLSTQQIMGNCYCIETFMSMYGDVKTRAELLEKMEEDKNGNIKITFNNYTPVILENAKLPDNEDIDIYSSGADGYKLLEYAYSCAAVEDKIKEARKKLPASKLAEFEDFIQKNPDNFYIYEDNKEIKWKKYSDFIKENTGKSGLFSKHAYKTYNNYLLGNGGLQNDVYKKLGYNATAYFYDALALSVSKKWIKTNFNAANIELDNASSISKASSLIKSPNFFDNHQVQLGAGAHAYNLTQETNSQGETKFYLYNPHNQGFPIEFEYFDDILSKLSQVTIVEIK